MDNFTLAFSRFKRNKFDDCIRLCDVILMKNESDLATQILKTHAIRRKNYVDDLEIDGETIGDKILDEYKISNKPNPGTSLQRPDSRYINQGIRPMSSSGRPLTGYVRPETRSNNNETDKNSQLKRLTTGNRIMTSNGRNVRVATASLQSLNSTLNLNISDINPKSIVKKKSLSRAVIDFLYYVDSNFKKCLEICSEGTIYSNYQDWWYKYKLGKIYNRLGLLADAEKHLLSSLKHYKYSNTYLQLSNIYVKMDQPLKAMDILSIGEAANPNENYFTLYKARIFEMLFNFEKSISLYKSVLEKDVCNFESIACIGAHYFYNDHPEVALKYYKRLIELGINSVEVWNNLGLCAYYSGQIDFCISCFERGLISSDDETSSEIWYNISHIAIGIGNIDLAYYSLKVSLQYNKNHFEAQNNLGVIESKRNNIKEALSNFDTSQKTTSYSYEPYFNYAMLSYKIGELEKSLCSINKSLEIYPDHFESNELKQVIMKELES